MTSLTDDDLRESLRMTSVYMAGPLFTAAEVMWNELLAEELRDLGFDVFCPQEQASVEVIAETMEETGGDMGEAIFRIDLTGLFAADVVLANLDGADPDSGTSWEMGAHFPKPTFWYRTDFRKTIETVDTETNIMLCHGGTQIQLDLGDKAHMSEPRDVASVFYVAWKQYMKEQGANETTDERNDES